MVNRERVKRGGLRAYELGRVRVAVRAAWLLVPLAVVCAATTGASDTCACVGAVLLVAAIFLRWRSRRGADCVRHGLAAGALPLIATLVVGRVAPACRGAPLVSICTALCVLLGAPAGVWLGFRLARRATMSTWFAAMWIAVLASSLGCVGLGVGGIVGAAVGLVCGGATALLARRGSTP